MIYVQIIIVLAWAISATVMGVSTGWLVAAWLVAGLDAAIVALLLVLARLYGGDNA